MELTGNELEKIFIQDKRKVCNTCHKIRIKTHISKYDFHVGHQNNICFCTNTDNRQRRNHQIKQDDEQQHELNEEQHSELIEEQKVEQNEEQLSELNEEQQSEQNEEQKVEQNEEQKKEQDEGGARYVTKQEFNQFKEEISKFKEEIKQKFNDIQGGFKTSFNEISKQIQSLKK